MGHLRRKPAASVPLEAVFDRWQRRRRRLLAAVCLAVVALALAAMLIPNSAEPAPVHVEMKVIEAAPSGAAAPDLVADADGCAWERGR